MITFKGENTKEIKTAQKHLTHLEDTFLEYIKMYEDCYPDLEITQIILDKFLNTELKIIVRLKSEQRVPTQNS